MRDAMEQRFARFAWGVLAYNLAVVGWGAFVRATGSGAGCGAHWPTCNGEVIPRAERVETLIELTHRVTSGLALALVVAELVWAFRVLPRGHRARSFAVAAMAFMLLEAAIGAGLVLLELVANDASAARALWMGAHLVNTFLLLATLALVPWSIAHPERAPRDRGGLAPALLLGAVLLLGTGAAGAMTALGDTLFPADSLASGLVADLSPTAHFLVRLRVIHPVLAIATALHVLVLAGFLAAARAHGPLGPTVKRWAAVVVTLVVAELAIGVVNLVLLAPVGLQIVHLVAADLLWVAFVLLGDVASRTRAGASRSSVLDTRAREGACPADAHSTPP